MTYTIFLVLTIVLNYYNSSDYRYDYALFLFLFFVSGHSNLMASAALASSSPSTAATAVGSTYHTVYINHPSMTAAPVTSTFLYHPSTAAQLSHPPALTSALPLGAQPGERVTSTTSWNVTGQCTSSPYAGETFFFKLSISLDSEQNVVCSVYSKQYRT